MRIVEIINSMSLRGGAEVFLYSLLKELAKCPQNEVILITLYPKIHESFKDIEKYGIKVFSCQKKKHIDFRASRKLKEIINWFKPDVVHTHLSCAIPMFLAYGFRKRKWLYFHTVHNLAHKESTGIITIINKALSKRNILKFIGISPAISKSIEKKYRLKNISTIYNGCEPLIDSKLSYSARKYDFICVARFYEQKNHLFLLETFKKFLEIKKDSILLLVGEGILKKRCEEYCVENGMNDNVVFVGSVDNVGEYLNISKCFVLSSTFEGNPISILEAMSVGLPIVATSVGGIPDVIENKKNGYLFHSNDGDAFLDSLKISLELNNWNTIRNNNLKKFNEYSMEKCASRYLKLFNGSEYDNE